MYYQSQQSFSHKPRFSPDFLFEGEEVAFFYSYIRKNASTSFKKLFLELYPDACPGDLPTIRCMAEHAQVKGLTPEEIDQRFATKLFVYRDPIDRVFSVYKNKLIQQDGAEDLLRRLEKVAGRDPALLTFEEFVHEYVVLLETERWEEVDGHLYPQVWHLLPITYNKVIRMDNVYQAMQELLPAELCDQVFKEPSNSTTKGSVPLARADPDCPAIYFRKKYAQGKALPSLSQLLTPATEARLREVYAEDYRMIEEVEGKPAQFTQAEAPLPIALNFTLPVAPVAHTPERALGLDFSLHRPYVQRESLSWLQKRMKIPGRLPPLRGWATSPDVLLHLHEHVMAAQPRLVVEFGSGASSLVIADALRQNGFGKLVSLDHSEHYGGMTRESLRREYLDQWVDLRIGELEPWTGQHLGRQEGQEDEALHWYPVRLLEGLEGIDMVLVDGPPGATCQHARYPALPALVERLSAEATVWMDDTIRQDEKDICEDWAQRYGMTTEYLAYEKGLGILRRSTSMA